MGVRWPRSVPRSKTTPRYRHPERSEGSKRVAWVSPFPWILRTAQDDGSGEYDFSLFLYSGSLPTG
jgi:hypothetical protein